MPWAKILEAASVSRVSSSIVLIRSEDKWQKREELELKTLKIGEGDKVL